MLNLDTKLREVYKKLEKVQDRMQELRSENEKLSEKISEKNDLISKLKVQNQELTQKVESNAGANELNNGQENINNNEDLRKEINQYIEVIDECLEHLKKI